MQMRFDHERESLTIYFSQTIIESRGENLSVLAGGERCHKTQMTVTGNGGRFASSRERKNLPTGGASQESSRPRREGCSYRFLRSLETQH